MSCRFELSKPGCAAGAFTTAIRHKGRLLWDTSAHLFTKTYYAALLLMPLEFARGLRIVFGALAWTAE